MAEHLDFRQRRDRIDVDLEDTNDASVYHVLLEAAPAQILDPGLDKLRGVALWPILDEITIDRELDVALP
jgi:hypothetical protein